jgi:hypothetical protein
MKFIYLGGIPAGTVPYIPMIGFDATVIWYITSKTYINLLKTKLNVNKDNN